MTVIRCFNVDCYENNGMFCDSGEIMVDSNGMCTEWIDQKEEFDD